MQIIGPLEWLAYHHPHPHHIVKSNLYQERLVQAHET